MKNKFRFKSLLLALLMVVTPIWGITEQNPFVVNSSALVRVEASKTKPQKAENQMQSNQKDTKICEEFTYGLVLKKTAACLGWSALGLIGDMSYIFTCTMLGGIWGVCLGSTTVMVGGVLLGMAGGAYCAAVIAQRSAGNVADLISALKIKLQN